MKFTTLLVEKLVLLSLLSAVDVDSLRERFLAQLLDWSLLGDNRLIDVNIVMPSNLVLFPAIFFCQILALFV
jgi:hypothetical protein